MENIENTASEKSRNILVVYYSRTGTTRKVAEYITKQLGADMEEIIDMKKRSGIWGFLIGGRDALKRKETKINEIKKDPSKYDLVIAGSPMWAGNITPAIRTYLNKYKTDIKSVAFFVTSGGSNQGKIFEEVRSLLDKELISLMGICTKELKDDSVFDAKLSLFIEGISQKK
ncbi:MAG: NAD(P)H-dependent oxidoreductase [Candidatus Atribacteria bacterium]|nr:NAD(P)H-dependent oxidoreductase [Candidatus Atribacteria bacterium]